MGFALEVPGAPEFADEVIAGRLAKRMEAGDTTLTLMEEDAGSFPTGEGIVRVGNERMSYERREGNLLLSLGRSGNAVAHDTVIGPPRRLQWQGGPRWSRHHDNMSSVSALVTSGGRVFYIFDEGPHASIELPSKWKLMWSASVGSRVPPRRSWA